MLRKHSDFVMRKMSYYNMYTKYINKTQLKVREELLVSVLTKKKRTFCLALCPFSCALGDHKIKLRHSAVLKINLNLLRLIKYLVSNGKTIQINIRHTL